MQPSTPELAPKKLTAQESYLVIGEYKYRLEVRLDGSWVVECGSETETGYRIDHAMGGNNVYYFLASKDRGRLQTLPLAYDVNAKEFFDMAASGLRHFPGITDKLMNWKDWQYTFNTSCYGCKRIFFRAIDFKQSTGEVNQMRRLFLALLICLTVSFDAFSQDSVATPMPNGMPSLQPANSLSFSSSILAKIPVLGGMLEEKILLNPFAMIGYQKTGVNMTVPINVDYDPFPNIPDAHLKMGSIDVILENFNFWYGTVGLNAIFSPRLTLFGSMSGYLPKTFLEYGKQPVSFGAASASYEFTMTGHGLELWNIQCGLSIGVLPGYSVLLGSLWQHTSMKFEDMRIGSLPVNPTLKQDFMLKNWAPFVGLQYLSPGSYRASVIYSPLLTSWGNLKTFTTSPRVTTLTYGLNQPGYLFGVTGEYFIPVTKTSTLSIWLTGAASVISGDSEVQLEGANISLNRTATVLNISQYSAGGGFTMGLTF